MKTATTATEVETPHGTLYVAVRMAQEDSYHETGQGYVTVLRPRLFVSTSPDFEAQPSAAEHWVIRGRKYGVQKVYVFNERHVEAGTDPWWGDHKDWDGDGYRNDRGGEVEWRTPTRTLLENTVKAAMNTYIAEHPEWAQLSVWLRHTYEANRLRDKVADLQAEIAKKVAEAEELNAKRVEIAEALSPATLDSVIPD